MADWLATATVPVFANGSWQLVTRCQVVYCVTLLCHHMLEWWQLRPGPVTPAWSPLWQYHWRVCSLHAISFNRETALVASFRECEKNRQWKKCILLPQLVLLPGTALPTHTIDGVLGSYYSECWAWISQPAPVVPMLVSDVTSSQLPRTINISSCSKTSPRAPVAADAAAAGPSISLQAECLCGSGGKH